MKTLNTNYIQAAKIETYISGPQNSQTLLLQSPHLYFTFGLPRSLITTSSPPVGPPVLRLDLPPSRGFCFPSHSPDQATRQAPHPPPLYAGLPAHGERLEAAQDDSHTLAADMRARSQIKPKPIGQPTSTSDPGLPPSLRPFRVVRGQPSVPPALPQAARQPKGPRTYQKTRRSPPGLSEAYRGLAGSGAARSRPVTARSRRDSPGTATPLAPAPGGPRSPPHPRLHRALPTAPSPPGGPGSPAASPR